MAIPGSLAWVSWRFLITLDRRKHLPAALPSLGRPKQEWWAASSCCVRPERSRSLDDEPCGKDDAGVAASSCIRTDELPATRRDARQISTRRRRRVRAQQQRHGQAAPREDFQGDTVHKSNFVALLVTSTPPTRRLPDGVAAPVPHRSTAPGARVDFAHRSPRARATTARTTTATSPYVSAAGSTRRRAAPPSPTTCGTTP